MTDCIFCKIINGEIPCAKVYEDDRVLAFLDLTQVTPGHTLLIPKKHVTDIFEYDSELAGEVFARLPKIARAIEEGLPNVKGLNILNNNRAVAYQSVFHSHIHLIPRYQEKEGFQVKFEDHSKEYSQEEFQERACQIHQAIKG
ncbi:HIT family protein [Facklamia languida]